MDEEIAVPVRKRYDFLVKMRYIQSLNARIFRFDVIGADGEMMDGALCGKRVAVTLDKLDFRFVAAVKSEECQLDDAIGMGKAILQFKSDDGCVKSNRGFKVPNDNADMIQSFL